MLSWLSRLIQRGEAEPASPPPKTRRPRRSKEEMIAVRAEQTARRKAASKERAILQRERMIGAGITRYRWATARDSRVCEHCKERAGKVFNVSDPLDQGFPGAVECCSGGACRCVHIALIEDFDY